MNKEAFVLKFSQGYVGDNDTLERRLAAIAEKIYDALNPAPVIVTDNKTLTTLESGGLFVVTADNKTMTLPAGEPDLEYTFVNGGANGAVLLAIDPDGTEIIFGTTNASTNVALSQAAGKKLLNTKATAIMGDTVKVKWVDGKGWWAHNFAGIWASET